MRSRTLDRIFPFWNKFTSNDQIHALLYTGRLASDHPGKMIFQANMTIQGLQGDPVPVIVKFTNSYCAEAHKLLASQTPPMAPNLYFCEVVKEVGMFVVVMDHITHTSFTALPQGVYDLLASAIKCLHLHNFVFGDLREPNILVTNDGHGLMLVDFDWSGKEGDAKYPADIALNSGILWHEDVKREGIIRKAHDEYLLCALESSVEASG
jgi:serine/threonine protein kinase